MDNYNAVKEYKCYVYTVKKTAVCWKCHEKLEKVRVPYDRDEQGNLRYCRAKYCKACKIYYVQYSAYISHPSITWNVINKEELNKFKKEMAFLHLEDNQHSEYIVNTENKRQIDKLKKTDYAKAVKDLEFEKFLKRRQARIEREKSEERDNIQLKDFVMRKSTFKCMYEKHETKNIDGIVRVLNRRGEIKKYTIPASYCEQCKIYFIMNSTYEQIKNLGVPLCRIISDKEYLHGRLNDNMSGFAQESILKQYGYSVSQMEGLTDECRMAILCQVIDNHIISKMML